MITEPIRDPQSQALIYPPTDPTVEQLQHELAVHRKVIGNLIDFIQDLPKPAGRNLTLDQIRKKL